MRLTLRMLLPIGLFVYAIGYCAFTLSLETTRMIGDSRGYDPGSQVVPLLAAACLAVTMLWEMIRTARADGPAQPALAGTALLVLANIAIAVALIGLFRPVGFVLTSSLALFALIALNLRAGGARPGAGTIVAGLVGTAVYATALYSLLRGIVRLCFQLARQYELPMLREPTLQASLVAVVLAIALFVVHLLLRRFTRGKALAAAVETASGVTLFVYVIFRLLFLVQLPAGLLNW